VSTRVVITHWRGGASRAGGRLSLGSSGGGRLEGSVEGVMDTHWCLRGVCSEGRH